MPQSFYVDLPRHSFEADVPANLVGKEFWPVELKANGKIQLLASGICIGYLRERLEGSNAWQVCMRGPIVKTIAGGAITTPAVVKNSANGVVAASSADKSHGIAIFPPVCAQNDIISMIMVDHVMP